MPIIYSQDWESGLPSGWAFTAAASVAASPLSGGFTPTSGTHVLQFSGSLATSPKYQTWQTLDGNSGNVVLQDNIGWAANGTTQATGLTARSNSNDLSTAASPTFYELVADRAGGALALNKTVSGTLTQIASIPVMWATGTGAWYQRTWTLSGSSLSATVRRLSDNFWLNSSGSFQSGAATAISVTDSSISGQGYSGLSFVSRGATAYLDDWALSTAAAPSPVLLPRPRIILPAQARRRGRIIVPASSSRIAPNPPTLSRPFSVSSPRRPHAGRVLIVANPGPYVPPPPVYNTPLAGLFVRPSTPRTAHRRRGSAALATPSPSVTTPAVGPIGGAMRIVGRRAHRGRDGLASVGRWLPPDPPPTLPLPWAAILHPVRRLEPAPRRGSVIVAPSRTLGITPDWPAFFGPSSAIRPLASPRRPTPGLVLLPRSPSIATPYVPGPTVPPLARSAMRPIGRRERPRPAVIPAWLGGPKRIAIGPGVYYNVYASPAAGRPIDYTNPVATTTLLTWDSAPLAVPGTWGFGVRAFNQWGEERNLDCAVFVAFDAAGHDVSNIPSPPINLRAIPKAGAKIDVIWSYQTPAIAAKKPTGFHAYAGIGSVDYTTPVATVLANAAIMGSYRATFSGSDATTYKIGVRAYNASGEEANTTTVSATADATGPLPVTGLTLTPIP